MASSGQKRHHVVPEFYLRRFANDDGQITAVKRDDPSSSYTTSVVNVAVQGYFYAIPTNEGWDNTIEDALSKLEDVAIHDVAALADGKHSEELRTRLSFFFGVQLARGRTSRQASIDFQKDVFKKILQLSTPEIIKATLERQGEAITIEEAAKVAAVGRDPTLRVEFQKVGPKGLSAESLVNAADVFKYGEKLIPGFYNRAWLVAEFDDPVILTSDEPIAYGQDTRFPGHPAGLANADSVVFPIDPHRALIMQRPDLATRASVRAKGAPVQSRFVNMLVAFRANKQIFHRPGTNPRTGWEEALREPES